MCDSGGDPITYEQLMPPEALDFRKLLYDYVGGQNKLFQQGAPQYPGRLPFTAPPGQGQMAGMNTILAMMGYAPYQADAMPGVPQNIYPDIYNPGRRDEDKDKDKRDDKRDYDRDPDDNPQDPDDPYAPRRPRTKPRGRKRQRE